MSSIISTKYVAEYSMKLTVIAWVVFFLGFLSEILLDYLMRSHDGNIGTGGLPVEVWFLIQTVLAAIALLLAYKATKPIQNIWIRVLSVIAQGIVGFGIYLFIGLSYICGVGIDCF